MAGPPHASAPNTEAASQTGTQSQPAPLLVCEELEKIYTRGRNGGWIRSGSDTTAVTAVDGVSVTISPGETVGLAGPSGSGKSTLHLIAGLESPTNGTIHFEETDLMALSALRR